MTNSDEINRHATKLNHHALKLNKTWRNSSQCKLFVNPFINIIFFSSMLFHFLKLFFLSPIVLGYNFVLINKNFESLALDLFICCISDVYSRGIRKQNFRISNSLTFCIYSKNTLLKFKLYNNKYYKTKLKWIMPTTT